MPVDDPTSVRALADALRTELADARLGRPADATAHRRPLIADAGVLARIELGDRAAKALKEEHRR